MNRTWVFLIRAGLGVLFAVVLTRLFHPEWPSIVVVLLASALVGLAYVLERKRK